MLLSPTVLFDQEIKDSFSIKLLNAFPEIESCPVRMRYHKVYLLLAAKGKAQIDDRMYPLAANQLLIIAKGQVLVLDPGVQIEGYEITFGDCFWEKAPASASNCKAILFNNAQANQQLQIAALDSQELQFLFHTAYLESQKITYTNQLDVLAAYLKIIMIKIANINASLHQGFDDTEKQLYRQYLELVSSQYKQRQEVMEFADQLHVTARKLTEICKRCSGKGAKEILNGQRIAEAKRALLFSPSPVKEIAYYLNFASPEQFSHFFKKYTGLSPNDYRGLYVNSSK